MTYPHVSGRRASLLEAAVQLVNSAQLGEVSDQVTDAVAEVNNMGSVVTDYGTAIDDLQINRVMPWAVPTVAPLSASINRRADPTFQLSDLMVPASSLTYYDYDGTVTYTRTLPDSDVARSLAQGGNVKGRPCIAFITPAITRVYTQLNFMVGQVSGPCPMDVAIYLVDPSTKTMTRQVLKADVSIPLGESVAVVEFDKFIANQGSYLAIAWLQRGTGNTRPLLGLNDTKRPLMNNVFPRKISASHTSGALTSLPATVNGETQVDFETFWFTPYAELSENVGIDYKAFTENWPDVGSGIGRPWVALTATGIGSGGGYTAAYGSGLRVSVYDTPLSTDFVRISSSIYRDQSTIDARRSTLIVRGTNDLRSGIGLSAISRTRYELISWSNLPVGSNSEWDDRAVLATIPKVPQQGDQIEVDYLDGSVSVRINGVAMVADLPVSGFSGPASRFAGIQNRRQSFITASFSPWFGPWSARDLPQTVGGDDGSAGD